jgi:hypothetical protein
MMPPMEEIEPPIEHAQEEIHHHAQHSPERWVSWVALSSALIAALAAVTALLAGHHANHGMLDQLRASDQWAYFQAKGVDQKLFEVERNLLEAQGKALPKEHADKLAKYEEQRAELNKQAREHQEAAEEHMARHVILAKGVTLFQIAIAVAAISVLTRRPRFWGVAMAFAAVGVFFLCQGSFFPHLFDAAKSAAHGG